MNTTEQNPSMSPRPGKGIPTARLLKKLITVLVFSIGGLILLAAMLVVGAFLSSGTLRGQSMGRIPTQGSASQFLKKTAAWQ
jgi:hypothetical protein